MEVAIIPAIFVAIFVGIAALILWFPYDAKSQRQNVRLPILTIERSRAVLLVSLGLRQMDAFSAVVV